MTSSDKLKPTIERSYCVDAEGFLRVSFANMTRVPFANDGAYYCAVEYMRELTVSQRERIVERVHEYDTLMRSSDSNNWHREVTGTQRKLV
jgi:hypothetical protein